MRRKSFLNKPRRRRENERFQLSNWVFLIAMTRAICDSRTKYVCWLYFFFLSDWCRCRCCHTIGSNNSVQNNYDRMHNMSITEAMQIAFGLRFGIAYGWSWNLRCTFFTPFPCPAPLLTHHNAWHHHLLFCHSQHWDSRAQRIFLYGLW